MPYQCVYPADVNEPVSMGAWHPGFTCATMYRAVSTAARAMSTEVPRDTYPCASGGDTWINATSSGRMFR